MFRKPTPIRRQYPPHNHQRDASPGRTTHQQRPPSHPIDKEQRRQRRKTIHNPIHARREQARGIPAQAELREHRRRVVDHSVAAHELLEEHDGAADRDALEAAPVREHGGVLREVQAQAGEPGVVGLDVGVLEEDGGFYVEGFGDEGGVGGGEAAEEGERGHGLLVAVLGEEPAGGFGVEEHAEAEDEGGDDLEGERDSPRGVGLSCASTGCDVLVRIECWDIGSSASIRDVGRATGAADVMGAVVDPEREEDPDGDGELLEDHETASDVWGRDFGDVERDDHGQHADGYTGNRSASEEHRNVDGTGLDGGADHEDQDCNHNVEFAA